MSEANVKFFVEGKLDARFVMDLALEHLNCSLDFREDFVLLGSWSGYKNEVKRFIENSDSGKINLLIIDADVRDRRTAVQRDMQELKIKAELFLFPDNNRVGELEHLLVDIAAERDIIECFEKYETCIKDYESVDPKGKIYAYLDALIPNTDKKKDEKILKDPLRWDFKNKDHWNLDHESLKPLLAFLTGHIKP
jgi:hypothetical protein